MACLVQLTPSDVGCRSCKSRPPFDVSVDITAALRANGLRRSEAALHVVVENAEGGECLELAQTPVPPPQIRGPLFESLEETQTSAETETLQWWLAEHGYKSTDVVDGVIGPETSKAILLFQVGPVISHENSRQYHQLLLSKPMTADVCCFRSRRG